VAGVGPFVLVQMAETAHNAYTALIPASTVTPLGVEYYILARDSKGALTSVGSATNPNFVVVQPRTIGMP
jgi:hypothetical protein